MLDKLFYGFGYRIKHSGVHPFELLKKNGYDFSEKGDYAALLLAWPPPGAWAVKIYYLDFPANEMIELGNYIDSNDMSKPKATTEAALKCVEILKKKKHIFVLKIKDKSIFPQVMQEVMNNDIDVLKVFDIGSQNRKVTVINL